MPGLCGAAARDISLPETADKQGTAGLRKTEPCCALFDESFALMISALCCMLAPLILMPIAMLGVPRWLNPKIHAWTADMTPEEAYEGIARTASTFIFQIRPASFMYECTIPVDSAPPDAIKGIATQFESG